MAAAWLGKSFASMGVIEKKKGTDRLLLIWDYSQACSVLLWSSCDSSFNSPSYLHYEISIQQPPSHYPHSQHHSPKILGIGGLIDDCDHRGHAYKENLLSFLFTTYFTSFCLMLMCILHVFVPCYVIFARHIDTYLLVELFHYNYSRTFYNNVIPNVKMHQ